MERIGAMKRKLYKYCRKLGIPRDMYPLAEKEHLAADGVYFSNTPQYSFCFAERGKVISRTPCSTILDVYYGILKILTFEMAVHAEVRQRKVGEDPRRQIFAIQHKLLSQLEPKFGQMYLDDMEKLLAKHPYDDGSFAV